MSGLVRATTDNIRQRIFTIRGLQVMVDRDLAELYGVENKRLNEQVKRNIERFPEKFRFQLTKEEKDELVANCDRFKSLKHSTVLPHVFTEQGVSMLSAVLRSATAVKVSVQIMDAFVQMRRFIAHNAAIFQRLDKIEQKQMITDTRLDKVFEALEAGEIKTFADAHDRFLILDGQTICHFGASLKDLGKKWFAISKFDKGAVDVLGRLDV